MRRDRWNTYQTTGYTHNVAQDQASAGGVHHHQVKLTPAGWMERVYQANGRHGAAGPATPIDAATGEAHYQTALADD